jgi:hypothetical protein
LGGKKTGLKSKKSGLEKPPAVGPAAFGGAARMALGCPATLPTCRLAGTNPLPHPYLFEYF